jgi:hypothetical protein
MRTFLKAVTTAAATAATVAATAATGATAAHAATCFGPPSIPAAYLCIDSVNLANAVPSTGPGPTVTVPAFCYLLGCTSDTPVNTVTVVPSGQPVLVFTYQGKTYEVPGNAPLADTSAAITPLNALLAAAGRTMADLCQEVAAIYDGLGRARLSCHV